MAGKDKRIYEEFPDVRRVGNLWDEIVAHINEADMAMSAGDERLASRGLDEALKLHRVAFLMLERFKIYEDNGEEVLQSVEGSFRELRRTAARNYAWSVKRADVIAERQGLRRIRRMRPDLNKLGRYWKKANKALLAAIDAFAEYEDGDADLDVGLIARAIKEAKNIRGFTMVSVEDAWAYNDGLGKEINLMYSELKRMS